MTELSVGTDPIILPLAENPTIVKAVSRRGFSDGVLDLQHIARCAQRKLNKMKIDTSSDQAMLKGYEQLLREKERCLLYRASKIHYYENDLIGMLAALFNRFFGCSPLDSIDRTIGNLDQKIEELEPMMLKKFSKMQLSELSKTAAINTNNRLIHTPLVYFSGKTIDEILNMRLTAIPAIALSGGEPTN